MKRYRRGVRNHQSRVDEGMVRYIRSSPEQGIALAERFGITPAAICQIRKRVTWRHVI